MKENSEWLWIERRPGSAPGMRCSHVHVHRGASTGRSKIVKRAFHILRPWGLTSCMCLPSIPSASRIGRVRIIHRPQGRMIQEVHGESVHRTGGMKRFIHNSEPRRISGGFRRRQDRLGSKSPWIWPSSVLPTTRTSRNIGSGLRSDRTGRCNMRRIHPRNIRTSFP